jgi:hypothetical protein
LFSIYCLDCVIVSSTFVQWIIVLCSLLFLRRYCLDCRYCSPLFGSTIVCISISRASAGSLYPSFSFNINLLLLFSLSLILLLLTLLVALIRHIGAWWCAITSQESAHRYHWVAQTPIVGEALLDPSLEPGPSRAITKAKAPALVDATRFKELLLDAHIQRRKVLQNKDQATTKVDYLLWGEVNTSWCHIIEYLNKILDVANTDLFEGERLGQVLILIHKDETITFFTPENWIDMRMDPSK